MKDKKLPTLAHAASPVARFLGHSLAVSLGFAGLALISLIPVAVVKALAYLGVTQLADHLHSLETFLLTVDLGVFAVVFLSGVTVFLMEILAAAKADIKKAWKHHDETEG